MAFAARLDQLPICEEGAKEMGAQLQKFLDECGKVRVQPTAYAGWLRCGYGGFMVHHIEVVMEDVWSHFHDPACIRCWPIDDRLKAWRMLADELLKNEPSSSTTRSATTPPPHASLGRRRKGALIKGQAYLMQFMSP